MPREYKPQVDCVCAHCGATFRVTAARASTARFCSVECRKRRVALTCAWCGEAFETFASRQDQRYCSVACQDLGRAGDLFDRAALLWDRGGGPAACWPWSGHRDAEGYGTIKFRGKIYKAHRLAFELANGAIDPNRPVCHACDNPPCGNPAHLWQGTNAENNADRNAKGRQALGERSNRSRLTAADVRLIRSLEGAMSYPQIAQRFGVSDHAIHCIIRRKTWRHVD